MELRGSGVVRVDPDSLDVVTAVPLDGTPTSLMAAGDRAWVVDADGQTVSEVSARGRRARTFATGAVPTDVAAGDGALWVTEGRQGATQTLTPVTRTLAHLDARSNAVRGRTVLPASRGTVSAVPSDRLALSRAAVWAIAGDGSVVQVDLRSEEVVRVLPFPALAVTATPDRAWILTADRTLLPVADRGSATGIPIDVPGSDVASIAAGEGGVWVTDPTFGTVTRVDRAGGAGRPFRVGAGIGPVAVGAGAVWVVDGPQRRLVRLDPSSGAISGEVALRGIPRDVAVSDDGVWVSVGSGSARASTLVRAHGGGPREGGRAPRRGPSAAGRGSPADRRHGSGDRVGRTRARPSSRPAAGGLPDLRRLDGAGGQLRSRSLHRQRARARRGPARGHRGGPLSIGMRAVAAARRRGGGTLAVADGVSNQHRPGPHVEHPPHGAGPVRACHRP